MRSYEECKQIATQLRNGEIEDYPIEVLERDGDIQTIVFLTFGLDGDMGFWKVDKLRETYFLTKDTAIDLIFQHEQPKVYTLQNKQNVASTIGVEKGHMSIDQIKKLEKTKVTSEQWEKIRHSDCVKQVSLQGKERGKTDYEVIFNDCTSVIIYI